jgi:hypothetical protein
LKPGNTWGVNRVKRPATVFGVLLVTAAIAWWLRGASPGVDAESPAASGVAPAGELDEPRGERESARAGEPFSKHVSMNPGPVSAAPPLLASPEASIAIEAQPRSHAEPALTHESAQSSAATAESETSASASDIDKAKCEAVARTLRESWSIFDLTPTFVVHYSRGNPAQPVLPLHPNSGFAVLQRALLGQLCNGESVYDPAYPAEFEFVAISETEYARIIVGNHWISDGTILSQLSESAYILLTTGFVQWRRRPGQGPNIRREVFDQMLAKRPQALFVR